MTTTSEIQALELELAELRLAQRALLTGKMKGSMQHTNGGTQAIGWQLVNGTLQNSRIQEIERRLAFLKGEGASAFHVG